jgi:hypothetical protein
MTERHGYGEQPSGERPSGRGAVAERRAREEGEVREVDLTDEAAASGDDERGAPPSDREASGTFEPHTPVGAPGAASTSIFDVGREEELTAGPAEPVEPTEPAAATDRDAEAADREAARDAAADREAAEREAAAAGVADEEAAAARAADRDAAATATPAAAVGAAETPGAVVGPPTALLAGLDTEGIRSRFLDIQAGFVDEPRQAVEEAGRFAEELVQQVIDALQAQRGQLHAPVDEGSTEDLRLALRSYRQFVDRLLGLAM